MTTLGDLLTAAGIEPAGQPMVVTRHSGLVTYLREVGLISPAVEVVEHVTDPAVLDGRVVIGVLPLHLAARCAAVVEVPLALTQDDRAAGDLPVERVREIAGRPVVYTVRRVGQLG